MMKNWKRAISFLLCAAMLLGNFPVVSFAAENDGLCEHHTVHESCGYEEGVSDCGYHCHDCEMANQPPATEETKPVCTRLADCAAENHEADCEKAVADAKAAEEEAARKAAEEKAVADKAAADVVAALIVALPALEAVQAKPLADALPEYNQVNAAYDAYMALTDDQKALLDYDQTFFEPYLLYFSGQTQEAATGGYCGDSRVNEGKNVTWSLENGVLTISGNGATYEYGYIGEMYGTPFGHDHLTTPWTESEVTSFVVEEGVTSILGLLAWGAYNLTSVSLPNSLKTIGHCSFEDCGRLMSITIPPNVTSIWSGAFYGCKNLTTITFTGDAPNINNYAFDEDVTATCYYPASANWPADKLKNYGGNLTWVAYDPCADGHTFSEGVCTVCGIIGGKCGTNLTWTLDAAGTLTISGEGAMANYSSSDAPWTAYKDQVNRIIIGDDVTSLSNKAFKYFDKVETIQLPDSLVSIGWDCFLGCNSLSEIDIPDSVTSIGSNAFEACNSLTSVTIPANLKTIDDGTFIDCINLITVTIPASVAKIGSNAFALTALTDINYASNEKAWNAINIHANNTYLADVTIHYTNLCKDGHNYVDGVCTRCDAEDHIASGKCGDNLSWVLGKDGKLTISGTGAMYDYAKVEDIPWFGNREQITSVVIDSGVTTIGNMAFLACSATGITIPNSVNAIGKAAFGDCVNLTSIQIPAGVTVINEGTFAGCRGLTSINLPSGVTSIGRAAFMGCHNLVSIEIPAQVTVLNEKTFSECKKLQSIIWPDNLTSIGAEAFSRCEVLNNIKIPNTVSTIGKYAFSGCIALTSIEIPSGVMQIADFTFISCSKLTNVTIPNTVTSIGGAAFTSCSQLREISIPNSVTQIGDGAFSDCYNLESISIPSGVTGIGIGTFAGCDAMERIDIPGGVTTIGDEAFANCSSLADVYFGGTSTQWAAIQVGTKNDALENAVVHCVGVCANGHNFSNDVCACGAVKISETTFPDANFRAYIQEQDYGTDGMLTSAELGNVTSIYVSYKNIKDLTGISYFTALETLDCSNNQLTTLDVSKNVELTYLKCSSNQLTALDVSKNVALTELSCGSNQLTALDVSKNVALRELYCGSNQLTALDVSKNVALTYLNCYSNQLTALDVSKNVALTHLACYSNQLTALDVSKNVALTQLSCYYNQLTALDVSKNTALTNLLCFGNKHAVTAKQNRFDLSTLAADGFDISKASNWSGGTVDGNILTATAKTVTYTYDLGRNKTETFTLTIDGFCVGHNFVEKVDSQYLVSAATCSTQAVYKKSCSACGAESEETFTSGTLDSQKHNFVNDVCACGAVKISTTTFPDDRFRLALVNKYDSASDYLLTAEEIANFTSVGVSNQGIADLTGIEYFTNLNTLYCYNNKLTALDLSENTKLKILYCNLNQLTALDVSKNTVLEEFDCNSNQLTALDVSKNTALKDLACENNSLTALDVSNNKALEILQCWNNQLTELDVSKNTALKKLICENNKLEALDTSKNTVLEYLSCSNNCLSSLDLNSNTHYMTRYGFSCTGNVYTITVTDNQFDLTQLPGNFDVSKVISLSGGTVDGNILTVTKNEVSYRYRVHNGEQTSNGGYMDAVDAVFTLNVEGSFCAHESMTPGTCKTPAKCGNCGYEGELDPNNHNFVDGICSRCDLPEGLVYTVVDDEVTITDYTGNATKLVIPATIEGKPVTGIGVQAFRQHSILAEIIIPDSVTSIGKSAFYLSSGLRKINIPKNVTVIGDFVFAGCSGLTEITIPKDVTSIGQYAFWNCSSLAEITIPKDITSISQYAFWNCSSLTDVYYAGDADAWASLDTKLPSGQDLRVHYECVGSDGHWEPKTVDATCETDGYTCEVCSCDPSYERGKQITIAAPGHKYNQEIVHEDYLAKAATCTAQAEYYKSCVCGTAGEETFGYGEPDYSNHNYVDGICSRCALPEGLDYTIANGEATITGYYGSATSLMIPATIEGVPVIGISDGAFYECSDLASIGLPNTLTEIGNYAFYGCSGLTTIDIPESVAEIGEYAFADCTNLKRIDIPASITALSNFMFLDCTHLETVKLPDGLKTIGASAFNRCRNLKDVTIPATVNEIGEYAFAGCWCIEQIVIPNGVTTLHAETFFACTSLTDIQIPDSVVKIERSVFQRCSSLKEIEIPASVESVGMRAFWESTALETVRFMGNAPTFGELIFLEIQATVCYPRTANGWTEEIMDDYGGTVDWKMYCPNDVHDYETTVTLPTCTEAGYTTYTCACGDTYTDDEKPMLNHTGGIATCKDKAVCSRCEETYGELDPENHTGNNHTENAKTATCTEEGYTGDEVCECGVTVKTGKVIEKAKHSYNEKQGSLITAGTCMTEAVYAVKCDNCTAETDEKTVKGAKNPANHVGGTEIRDAKTATCTVDGYTGDTYCVGCQTKIADGEIITAPGHEMGEWTVVTEPAGGVNGEQRRDCANCDYFETQVIPFVGNILKLEGENLLSQSVVYINGLPYPVNGEGDNRYVELPSEDDCYMVTYTYHVGDAADVHTQYPTGMKVYKVAGGKLTYIPELDNLLQYSGSSIRITGKKGIRMITSLTKDTKAALTGNGLAGYKLLEYGTALCFASEVEGDGDLVLGKSYTRSNYAYKKGVADPVFATSGNLTQYTNVLVGFSLDQCKDDIAMRPYIILEDADGQQVTLYGGTIYRSIGYIAYQNRNVFQPKTASYNYVWEIIHHVYGDKYDADYKG